VLPLGLNFFGLSSNHKKTTLDEFYYLIKFANFSYSDVMNMPTFERRYFIDKLVEEYEKKSE
jgi:hypothetical protein